MFNPTNGKCDHVNPQKCRPGEQLYIPSSLKEVEITVRTEQLKDNRPKVIKRKGPDWVNFEYPVVPFH